MGLDLIMNRYQTPLTKELIESLPKEVYRDLIDTVNSIEFIRNLIASEEVRGYAKDRPRDESGKIIVDITKPHILENMDFFRERAIHFQKYGKYTLIPPDPNQRGDYALFWKEELRRWRDGLVRKFDGEWIPGYYYFYLNYSPIWINVEIESEVIGKRKRRVKGIRKKEFPDPWLGDYLCYHYFDQARQDGGHAKILKARGRGLSFKLASMTPCTMYVQPGLPNFHLASDKTYLLGDKGVFGKAIDTLDWIADNTPFLNTRLINQPLEKKLGYIDTDGVSVQGLKSSVIGLSLKDDPDKARGVRGPIIHYEEDGLFPHLEDAWNINREAVEEGGVVFGLMIAAGTGGTEGADFVGSAKLFYNPDAYNIYGLPNVYDKNVNKDSYCGFFWGAYLNRKRYYDAVTGESDVIGALIEILLDRYHIKQASQDAKVLTQRKAEQPITPQEAIMVTEGTIFPIADIRDVLAEIIPNIKHFVSAHHVGKLIGTEEGVEFRPDASLHVIHEYPLQRDYLYREGALEIFNLPIRTNMGKTLPMRYIAGIDPVDDDYSSTASLPSIFIFDRLFNLIVAEYTGRPKTAYEFYEVCRKLLMYYGAIANYENDKKGLFAYFSTYKCLHLLCDTPSFLKQIDYIKGEPFGNKAKGTNSSHDINALGRRLQADWLVSPAYGEEETGRQNLHMVRSIAYLQELSQWNVDGNFDRISAMGMCMIYREELAKYTIHKAEAKSEGLANDPYWSRFNKNVFNTRQDKMIKEGWVRETNH